MNLREWIAHWQETYDKPRSRPTTYAGHNYVFKNHILPGLGDMPLSELTEGVVGSFIEERRKFGGHRPEAPNYPGLGRETIRHIQTLLQAVLEQAVQDGLMEENPVRAFYYSKPKTVNANVLMPEEAELYLDAAEQLGYLPMFLLELTIGLRPGELIALKWSDLDTDTGILTIAEKRAVERTRLQEYGDQTRQVQLTPEIVAQLKLEHEKHPFNPMMFPHPGTRRPYTTNMLRLIHKRITETAGIRHVRLIDLRHTCAAHALRNGTEAKEVKNMLGHDRLDRTRNAYGEYIAGDSQGIKHGQLKQVRNELDRLDMYLKSRQSNMPHSSVCDN